MPVANVNKLQSPTSLHAHLHAYTHSHTHRHVHARFFNGRLACHCSCHHIHKRGSNIDVVPCTDFKVLCNDAHSTTTKNKPHSRHLHVNTYKVAQGKREVRQGMVTANTHIAPERSVLCTTLLPPLVAPAASQCRHEVHPEGHREP